MKQFLILCLLITITLQVGETAVIKPANKWPGVNTNIMYCGMINAKIYSLNTSNDSRKGYNLFFSKFVPRLTINKQRFQVLKVTEAAITLQQL